MNPQNLDLVLFVPSLEGGIGRVTTLLAEGLNSSGKKVEIWSAAFKKGYGEKIEHAIKIRYIGNGNIMSAFIPMLSEIKKNSPNFIISASFHANCLAILASFFSSKSTKFIIADHPSIDAALKEFSFIKRTIWRILIFVLYRMAYKHVAISKGVANAMSKFSGINKSKINLIPNPVINDEIYTQSSKFVTHPFFKLNKPILLYVGRLSHEKNVGNIIRSFKKSQKSISSRLLIIGDGPQKRKLEKLVIEECINKKVSFLGHKDNPYPYFVHADLFVLSSNREGLPTVLIEALAFNLKIVSTDCPSGPREILRDGLYGKLVKLNDSDAFSHAIVTSLREPKLKIPKPHLEQYKSRNVISLYSDLIS